MRLALLIDEDSHITRWLFRRIRGGMTMRRSKQLFPFVAMAVVVLMTAGCAQPDPLITGKVKASLAVDSNVRATQIEVATKDGVVTLTGNIDSQAEKDRALEIARSTNGVKNVVDMIAVRTGAESGDAPDPNRTVGEHVDDAVITAAVKTHLLEDPMVKGSQIDVDTRAGVVFLTGSVRSQAESQRAVEVARATEHVKDVRANLNVVSG
jgi:hyperosmotically inducible protein